jgi:hypothetical protein
MECLSIYELEKEIIDESPHYMSEIIDSACTYSAGDESPSIQHALISSLGSSPSEEMISPPRLGIKH